MSRTRLSQLEQIEHTVTYTDRLSQPSAENPAQTVIADNVSIAAFTNTSIGVSKNFSTFDINPGDEIEVFDGIRNNGRYKILAISENQNSEIKYFVVDKPLLQGSASGKIKIRTNPNKSLDADINHIRTQLRKLNKRNLAGSDHWYDEPAAESILVHATNFEPGTITAGTALDVGANYDAGTPFDLSIYLNGSLLKPSIIENGEVVSSYDYQEVDDHEELVSVGEIGRKIKLNFDLIPGDILQCFWSK